MPSNMERTEVARTKLLEAAARLIQHEGAASLTLAAVAREAQVSKGALTHHFPSKEALIRELLEVLLTGFEQQLETSRLPYPVAYVRQGVSDGTQGLAAGLLTALALYPAALEVARQHAQRWQEQTPGLDATIARLATDGLWLGEVLGLPALPPVRKEALLKRLEELAGSQA